MLVPKIVLVDGIRQILYVHVVRNGRDRKSG